MKLIAFVMFSLLSNLAFAAGNTYQLDMEITMNNKTSKPQIMIREGEKGSITAQAGSEEHFVDIVATESTMNKKKGILMKFVVGVVGADGKRTIFAKPQVFTLENEKATITSEENKNTVSLIVTPHKAKM